MIDSYQNGLTPNPDVLCNEKIKFGHFLRYALAEGADYVATGHYATINLDTGRGIARMFRAEDTEKDQSYFLYRLGQEELVRALFPIGSFRKIKVRELAKSFGLSVAQKRDSQGLCFVGPVSIPEFLSRYITLVRGNVLNSKGDIVGEHDGAALFTVGQRHGFRLTIAPGKPLYVTEVNVKANTISVDESIQSVAVTRIAMRSIHWINESYDDKEIFVQTRYRQEAIPARIEGANVVFETPQVVSAGQSIVFYQSKEGQTECYGGAIAGGMHTSA